MAKSKEQKKQIVERLTQRFKHAKSAVFVNFSGLTVPEATKLRKICYKEKVDYIVAKKTLMRIAVKEAGFDDFDPKQFNGEVAIAFGMEDEVAPAKVLYDFSKDHDQIKFLGGILEHTFVDQDQMLSLAKLPSRGELLAKVVGSLQSPISGVVNVLAGNLRGLVQVLSQIKEKRS